MSAHGLVSHASPKRLYLRSHVAAVRAAAEAIVAQSGLAPWRETWAAELLPLLARLHDLGKGSAAFQAYIHAPEAWKGDPSEKAHTPLSLVLTLGYAQAERWDETFTLAAALAVRGHHGGQVSEGEELSRALIDDVTFKALSVQIASLDLALLGDDTGLTLPSFVDATEAIDAARDAIEDALTAFRRRTLGDAVTRRFLARAAYSVLLEADKAFLAVEPPRIKEYLQRKRSSLACEKVEALCAELPKTPMDALRARALAATREGLTRDPDAPLRTLTLPTGAGKTLIAARWALDERARAGGAPADAPTIILALPMLSIVDQTEAVWRAALGAGPDDGDTLLPYHSLSAREYDSELERGTEDFYIDTWRSEVVVTTFDQLLLALYSDRAKHAMRYHRLLNARIVLDEAQYVPPVLWTALTEGLRALTELGTTRVLAMSATPSPCIEGAREVLEDPSALYAGLARYELTFEHETPVDFETFIARTIARCHEHRERGETTLVTLNVRATAQETWERLCGAGLDPWLLSGDMTPAHRLTVIARLKAGASRVVVSTQCVEAGVDLDMHHVIRDFAPLDALVQIAGRCNRHAKRSEPGTVTVVRVKNPHGRDDAGCIYDPVSLQCTEEVLRGAARVPEREVLGLCRAWFARIAERRYRGGEHFRRWARIEDAIDVRKLLRGEDHAQRALLVIEHDPGLMQALGAAFAVEDRWERRSALRALSARLARHTVSVPERVFARLATEPLAALGDLHVLGPGQYHDVRGIDSR